MRHAIGLFALFAFALSCTHSESSYIESESYKTVYSDQDYLRELEFASKDTSVFHDFDTLYTLNVTFFSRSFKGVYDKRVQERFNHTPKLEEIEGKLAFFVSIFSPRRDFINLSEDKVWEISLKNGAQQLKPVRIQKLTKKEEWLPFFPYVNRWSREYVVIFDPVEGAPEDVNLRISSLYAQTVMRWPEG